MTVHCFSILFFNLILSVDSVLIHMHTSYLCVTQIIGFTHLPAKKEIDLADSSDQIYVIVILLKIFKYSLKT